MAVTSIWPIKGRVDKVINYARNPEKTHDKERLSELHEIEGVVEYAADEMKTEKRAYVTCLNLHSEETAAQEFMETKRLMHNEGGRSCYHGYQSFKADEVDADTAHSIYLANLDPYIGSEQGGTRPVVVLQNNTGNYYCPTLIVAPITSKAGKKPSQPTHYYAERIHGLDLPGMVLLEQIKTIDKRRVKKYLGRMTRQQMDEIGEAIEEALGLYVPEEMEAP